MGSPKDLYKSIPYEIKLRGVKIDRNSKAWLLGTVLGIIGIILSAVLFVFITLKTGRIFGIVAVICGAISGGAVGLGYKLCKGTIKNKSELQTFLWIPTLFGLLGVLAAYFGPYIFFATKGLSFSLYATLIGFGFMDFLFILIGAYGGRLVGKSFARSIIMKEILRKEMQKGKQRTIKKIDKKFK